MPRGEMLHTLMTLTGLTVRELVPSPEMQALRRVRDYRKQLNAKRRRRRLATMQKGKPPRTLTVAEGVGARTPRPQRRRARR